MLTTYRLSKYKYRSKFEISLATSLKRRKAKFKYEALDIPYILEKKYKTDFTLRSDNLIIEAKGVLTPDDRRKMKAVKAQHPHLDIRFVFQNADNKLNKKSKTTYAQWAEKNGFLWAHKDIPDEWLNFNENTNI